MHARRLPPTQPTTPAQAAQGAGEGQRRRPPLPEALAGPGHGVIRLLALLLRRLQLLRQQQGGQNALAAVLRKDTVPRPVKHRGHRAPLPKAKLNAVMSASSFPGFEAGQASPTDLAEAALKGAVKQDGLLGQREGQPLGYEAVRLQRRRQRHRVGR